MNPRTTYKISAALAAQLDNLPKCQDGLSEFAALRRDFAKTLSLFDLIHCVNATEYDAHIKQIIALRLVNEANEVLQRKKLVVDILCSLYDSAATIRLLNNAREIAKELSPALETAVLRAFPIFSRKEEQITEYVGIS